MRERLTARGPLLRPLLAGELPSQPLRLNDPQAE
jgi:hypothetical protein